MHRKSAEKISHLYKNECEEWIIQSNDSHCYGVADLAAGFASGFGMSGWGQLIGMMHDRGKEKEDFQKHIKRNSGFDPGKGTIKDPHHSLAGALLLNCKFPDNMCLMSNPVAGHHRGLYDLDELEMLLRKNIPEEISHEVPDVIPDRPPFKLIPGNVHHLTRMLFSCLVDADYLDTERFMDSSRSRQRSAASKSMTELREMLDNYLEGFRTADDSSVNRIRNEVQAKCREKADSPSGLFELTVPTGGGKTLASVLWAIKHAIANNKKRIVIAIPFTSIIVQTAQTLRGIFGDENVLEHHSVINEEEVSDRNRLASENWDAPIVVTTNVQLFESMFASRPGRCRKLHSLVNSVVILDEIQSLPMSLLQPIVDAIKAYSEMFGTSFLFCTASQPVLDGTRKGCGNSIFTGFEESSVTKIIDRSHNLYDRMRRVTIDFDLEPRKIPEIAGIISKQDCVLCVVNTRRLAAELFSALPEEGFTRHLSRMMCPAHIRKTIEEIRHELASRKGYPVRVVSTQLIEAGVDIDFPVVFRQLAGLDSILQAAGRCNREGKNASGNTHVFQFEGYIPRGTIASASDAMKSLLTISPEADWLSDETMRRYFDILYSKTPSFDSKGIVEMSECPSAVQYESIGNEFRMIDETGINVIVNYLDSDSLIRRLMAAGPSKGIMKKLGQYSVPISVSMFEDLCRAGLIEEVWEGIFFIPLKDQYDNLTGLRTENTYLEQTYIT